VLTVLATTMLACRPAETGAAESWTVQVLRSETVDDDYCIYVHVPAACQEGACSAIYYLDADWNTALFRELLPDHPALDPLISVGIGYPDPGALNRNRDYLSPYDEREPLSGGGEQFYGFLTDELVPWVEARWPIAAEPGNTLLGHSYGGYFAAWVLYQEAALADPVFPRLLSASPTLGWADDHLLQVDLDQATLGSAQTPRKLFLGMGEFEDTLSLVAFDTLVAQLAERDEDGFASRDQSYAGADHDDTGPLVLIDGLGFLAE